MIPVKNIKSAVIIDRTLPEIITADKMSRLDILNFCWLLEHAGVNVIEVNACLLSKIGKPPEGLDFVLQAGTVEDLDLCIASGIKRCVFKPVMLPVHKALERISGKDLFAILEINVENLEDLSWADEISGKDWLGAISCIRLTGLGEVDSHEWLEKAWHIKTITGKCLDICPEYSMSMGNAILQEAAVGGMDFVTSSFTGYGRKGKFASTEILLAALKVLYNDSRKSNLEILPELKILFEKHSQQIVYDNSPVIGKNIFMIESGIHAAGINSDSRTYEPYGPDIVGQKRELVIGKHSGRLSIAAKMIELDMEVNSADLQQLLQKVRELSVKLNRSLNEEEFIDICKYDVLH
jgi:homocitrate synthase NifV